MQLVALYVGDIAVDRGGVHQQRRRGETIIVGLEAGRILPPCETSDRKFLKAFEHRESGLPALSRRHVARRRREVQRDQRLSAR